MAGEVSAAPKAAAAGTGDAPPKIEGARNDVQARIAELSAQKAHFQQKATKFENELRSLRDEVATVKGQLSAQPATPQAPRGPAKTWGEMSEEQLDNARSYAREHEQPEVLDAVHSEITRREAEKARKAAVEESTQKMERKLLLRDIHQRIVDEYGPEAFDPEGEMYQRADRYLREQANLYGEASASEPHRLLDAFAHADRNRVKGDRTRITELEQENLRLKEMATLAERGGPAPGNARPLSDEVKELVKAGELKKATRKLATTQALTRMVKNSLLPNR